MADDQKEKNPTIRKLDHLDQTLRYCRRIGMTYAEYQMLQTFQWLKEQEVEKSWKKRQKK